MNWLALSIFASTVLFLVDKNQAWGKFWRIGKWALQASVGIIIGTWFARYGIPFHFPIATYLIAFGALLVAFVLANLAYSVFRDLR